MQRRGSPGATDACLAKRSGVAMNGRILAGAEANDIPHWRRFLPHYTGLPERDCSRPGLGDELTLPRSRVRLPPLLFHALLRKHRMAKERRLCADCGLEAREDGVLTHLAFDIAHDG